MFFERITKENIAKIGEYLNKNIYSCEYTPANLLIWSKMFDTHFALLGDAVCFRYEESNGPVFSLLGAGAVNKIKTVTDYCLANNFVPKISVNEEQIDDFLQNCSDFDIFESEKSAEYIYTTEALSSLQGKKYHSKRNHISAFTKQYNWTFENITEQNKNEILEISDYWISNNEKTNEHSISTDREGIEMLLDNFAAFRVRGGIVRVDGKAVAFCLGTQVSDKVFDINFEKALPEYKGAYAVINREFAKTLTDFEFINREDDLGIAGLRKAKMSYHPHKTFKKYIVMPKFVKEQTKQLYLKTFTEENEKSADLLFDKFFVNNTLLKMVDRRIVSLLFLIDASIDLTESAYIYGAATDENYRNRGLMRQLIDFAALRFDALYLKPANDDLFEFYQNLGFKTAFYKNKIVGLANQNSLPIYEIKNTQELYKIRDILSPEISVHLCDAALEYILENYTAVTDNPENPQNFALFTVEGNKVIVNEALSKTNPDAFLGELCYKYNCAEYEGFTVGEDIPCGMIKTEEKFPKKMYMGLDID